jgi:hypothetical protein
MSIILAIFLPHHVLICHCAVQQVDTTVLEVVCPYETSANTELYGVIMQNLHVEFPVSVILSVQQTGRNGVQEDIYIHRIGTSDGST